jgi:hypothetical protein
MGNRGSLVDKRSRQQLIVGARGEEPDPLRETIGEPPHLRWCVGHRHPVALLEDARDEFHERLDDAILGDGDARASRLLGRMPAFGRGLGPDRRGYGRRDVAADESRAALMERVELLLGRTEVIDVRHRLVDESHGPLVAQRRDHGGQGLPGAVGGQLRS